MLGLLPEKGGEIHLLFETTFGRHHLDQGQQIEDHGLLAGLKQRAQPQQKVALVFRQGIPVFTVALEIDRPRIPDSVLFGFLPKTHR